MSIESVRAHTLKSNGLLELARHYAEQAEVLAQNDPKRTWLEDEVQRLINEARALTEEARKQVAQRK